MLKLVIMIINLLLSCNNFSEGTAGFLYSKYFAVKLDYTNPLECQSVIDGPNAAVCDHGEYDFLPYYDYSTIIMDHNHQGFKNLNQLKIGDYVFLQRNGLIYPYKVDQIIVGHEDNVDGCWFVADESGVSLYQGYEHGITLQTCIDNYYRLIVRCRND